MLHHPVSSDDRADADRADVINELVDEMRMVVDSARDRDDRNGYFAAMYLGVTTAVERGVETGAFTTPDRLSALTVAFARRYLHALELHQRGGHPSASWQVAFDAAQSWRPTLLQHLLLGINAHINLDLGVACAEVAPGAAIVDLEPDFAQINNVLAGLVRGVQRRLNRVSPLYRFVDDITGDTDHAVVNFSIARARDEAWRLATRLAPLDAAEARSAVASRDLAVAELAQRVRSPGAIASTGLMAVRLTERRSVADVIELLTDTASAERIV